MRKTLSVILANLFLIAYTFNCKGQEYVKNELEELWEKCHQYDGTKANDSIFYYADQLAKKASDLNHFRYKMNAISYKAKHLITNMKDVKGGEALFLNLIDEAKQKNEFDNLFIIRSNYATLKNIIGDYEEAIKLQLENIKLAEEKKLTDKLYTAYFSLSTLWGSLGDYSRAEEYLALSEKYLYNCDDVRKLTRRKLYVLAVRGASKMYSGNCSDAITDLKKAREYCRATDSFIECHLIQAYLGKCYLELGNLDSSYYYTRNSVKYIISHDDRFNFLSGEIYEVTGHLYSQYGIKDTSIMLYKKANEIYNRNNIAQGKDTLLRAISNYYEDQGEYDSAFHYLSMFHEVHNTMYNKEREKVIQGYQIKYDSEREDNELLQAKISLYNSRNKRVAGQINKIKIIAAIFFMTILAVITITLIVYIKREENKVIQESILANKIRNESLQNSTSLLNEELTSLRNEVMIKRKTMMELEEMCEELSISNSALVELFNMKILTESDWQHFKKSFMNIYPNFLSFEPFKKQYFTTAEIRLLMLSKISLETKEIAYCLGITDGGVRTTKHRIVKKLKGLGVKSFNDLMEILPN